MIDKRQIFKKQYTENIQKIYTYYKSMTISLSNPERVPERIQEEKAKFLKIFKTQENQIDFIERAIQDYQNIRSLA
ncbi:hypothetical protein RHABOEDO_001561 [Candidatus Rhabdochlamydia oedothoracis]|uniref:Uncharacterized protein n=1 Tax=Candidatus Rhabdochlamydia oedothoracis TaxID=2720720 RepID=A0ABX8V1Z8_9BACT|nr:MULTISPECIES: hypothetical protein [Rhabdochlamydia]MCL6756621.1 hypothetical protein [Candidatus Rhabdochlamydia oedothoracis]QYF49259.1 hypothetical protein RHABOEDO_001561 [Candidatus Rhabdochlamydia oedothoracis]